MVDAAGLKHTRALLEYANRTTNVLNHTTIQYHDLRRHPMHYSVSGFDPATMTIPDKGPPDDAIRQYLRSHRVTHYFICTPPFSRDKDNSVFWPTVMPPQPDVERQQVSVAVRGTGWFFRVEEKGVEENGFHVRRLLEPSQDHRPCLIPSVETPILDVYYHPEDSSLNNSVNRRPDPVCIFMYHEPGQFGTKPLCVKELMNSLRKVDRACSPIPMEIEAPPSQPVPSSTAAATPTTPSTPKSKRKRSRSKKTATTPVASGSTATATAAAAVVVKPSLVCLEAFFKQRRSEMKTVKSAVVPRGKTQKTATPLEVLVELKEDYADPDVLDGLAEAMEASTEDTPGTCFTPMDYFLFTERACPVVPVSLQADPPTAEAMSTAYSECLQQIRVLISSSGSLVHVVAQNGFDLSPRLVNFLYSMYKPRMHHPERAIHSIVLRWRCRLQWCSESTKFEYESELRTRYAAMYPLFVEQVPDGMTEVERRVMLVALVELAAFLNQRASAKWAGYLALFFQSVRRHLPSPVSAFLQHNNADALLQWLCSWNRRVCRIADSVVKRSEVMRARGAVATGKASKKQLALLQGPLPDISYPSASDVGEDGDGDGDGEDTSSVSSSSSSGSSSSSSSSGSSSSSSASSAAVKTSAATVATPSRKRKRSKPPLLPPPPPPKRMRSVDHPVMSLGTETIADYLGGWSHLKPVMALQLTCSPADEWLTDRGRDVVRSLARLLGLRMKRILDIKQEHMYLVHHYDEATDVYTALLTPYHSADASKPVAEDPSIVVCVSTDLSKHTLIRDLIGTSGIACELEDMQNKP